MQNIANKFEPVLLEAINDFEKEFGESDSVTWGIGLDFYPDLERATDDNVPLVATLGIYLEIPNDSESVVNGSIFVPPQLEAEQIYKAVFDSLVALRQKRTVDSPK